MGMFDSVYARCPKCNERIEFQTKAGDCNLDEFETDEVPVEIASALDGRTKLCDCGTTVELKFPRTSPKWVSMTIRTHTPYY